MGQDIEVYSNRVKVPLDPYENLYVEREIDSQYAIIIPLFKGFDVIPEYHVTSAFYVMQSILLHTDVVEKGIPIIFYVDRTIWDDIKYLFEAGNIPESDVMFFDPIASSIEQYYLGLKLMPLLDQRIQDLFEVILLWDADMFVVSKTAQKMDTDVLFESGVSGSIGAIHVSDDMGKPFRIKETHRLFDTYDQDKMARSLSKQLIGKEVTNVFSVGGCLYRFIPWSMSQAFRDYLTKAIPLIGDDEIIIALWSLYSGESIDVLDKFYPAIVYEMCHYDWHRDNTDVFLAHIWTESIRDASDWRVLKLDAGVYRTYVVKSDTHSGVMISFPYDSDKIYAMYPKVVALNLLRREDRRISFEKHLRGHSYSGNIEFWEAVDRQEYGSRRELLLDACQEYSQFEGLIDYDDDLFFWDAYQWSYLRCLKRIADQSSHVLLFEDDMGINMDWNEFIAYINELPLNLNFALLNYNHDIALQHNLPQYCDGWELGCKSNGTSAVLYSPEGAALLYETILVNCGVTAEVHVSYNKLFKTFSANPVCVVSLPEAGDSDLTKHHSG